MFESDSTKIVPKCKREIFNNLEGPHNFRLPFYGFYWFYQSHSSLGCVKSWLFKIKPQIGLFSMSF